MVLPVYKNIFKIGPTKEELKTVADLETFSVSIDNGIEEWYPMEHEGWVRRLMTSKALTISLNGKRNIGDEGNDYVAGLALLNGTDANAVFEWVMPSGTTITFNCVVSITELGGDSTNAEALGFEVQSDGKPEVTMANSGE